MFIQVSMGVEEERVKGPLELELQVVVSSPRWLLGAKLAVFLTADTSGASSALLLVVFVLLWFGFGGQSLIMWFGLA